MRNINLPKIDEMFHTQKKTTQNLEKNVLFVLSERVRKKKPNKTKLYTS